MAMDCSSWLTRWPLSPARASPCPPPSYIHKCLHNKPSHRLAPPRILPNHVICPSFPISHPWAPEQMCCILRRPPIAYAPL